MLASRVFLSKTVLGSHFARLSLNLIEFGSPRSLATQFLKPKFTDTLNNECSYLILDVSRMVIQQTIQHVQPWLETLAIRLNYQTASTRIPKLGDCTLRSQINSLNCLPKISKPFDNNLFHMLSLNGQKRGQATGSSWLYRTSYSYAQRANNISGATSYSLFNSSSIPSSSTSTWAKNFRRIQEHLFELYRRGGEHINVIIPLIGLNLFILLLWKTLGYTPEGKAWMWKNFMVSITSIKEGRIWTLLTSCVSHSDVMTFLVNSTTLYFLGHSVLSLLGNRLFLALYFTSGILSGLFHLSRYQIPSLHANPTPSQIWYSNYASMQAATASTLSVAGFFAVTWPYQYISLYGVLPIPAWALVAGIAALSIYNLDAKNNTVSDTILGISTGVLLGFAAKRFGRI